MKIKCSRWDRVGALVLKFFIWAFCVLSTMVAFSFTWLSYGHRSRMLPLFLVGTVAGFLVWQFTFLSRIRFGLLAWSVAALMTVLVLITDVFFGSRIFLWKHAHTDLFLGGAPSLGTHAWKGTQIHIFDGGFVDSHYYALRDGHGLFVEYAEMPTQWRSRDPLPDNLEWRPFGRWELPYW